MGPAWCGREGKDARTLEWEHGRLTRVRGLAPRTTCSCAGDAHAPGRAVTCGAAVGDLHGHLQSGSVRGSREAHGCFDFSLRSQFPRP